MPFLSRNTPVSNSTIWICFVESLIAKSVRQLQEIYLNIIIILSALGMNWPSMQICSVRKCKNTTVVYQSPAYITRRDQHFSFDTTLSISATLRMRKDWIPAFSSS